MNYLSLEDKHIHVHTHSSFIKATGKISKSCMYADADICFWTKSVALRQEWNETLNVVLSNWLAF